MARLTELRPQSVAPTIQAGVVGLWINTGNVLVTQVSGSGPVTVGLQLTGSLPNTAIQTGTASYLLTGTYFGVAQGALLGTGLGTPFAWIPILSGSTTLAIPAYKLA